MRRMPAGMVDRRASRWLGNDHRSVSYMYLVVMTWLPGCVAYFLVQGIPPNHVCDDDAFECGPV